MSDGDTISVLRNGRAERVRLNGIDAPEKGQAFGNRAKQFTSSLAFGTVVTARGNERDRYGRLVADVILSDGRSLNHGKPQWGQELEEQIGYEAPPPAWLA